MKIYTLESKNEVLAILTHTDNMSYREFKRICNEANEYLFIIHNMYNVIFLIHKLIKK